MKGSISISRTSSNQTPDYMTIELRLEGQPGKFAVIEMELEPFLLALTGKAQQECEIDLRGKEINGSGS